MPPAARITDAHTCATCPPNVITGPCAPTVLIGGLFAARVSDLETCTAAIAKGSPTVITVGLMQARLGDPTTHGGLIAMGCPTVIVGEVGAGMPVPPGSGMANLQNAMSAGARTPAPTDSPQATGLADAAAEGAPMAAECPYAHH